jgi:hypothetical protein
LGMDTADQVVYKPTYIGTYVPTLSQR